MNNWKPKVRKKIYDVTKGKCYYCGCELDFDNFQVDHFVPRKSGGKNTGNRVPACCECNAVKTDKSIEEFRETVYGYATKDLHVRMINKYMGIDIKDIVFYFETNKVKPI